MYYTNVEMKKKSHSVWIHTKHQVTMPTHPKDQQHSVAPRLGPFKKQCPRVGEKEGIVKEVKKKVSGNRKKRKRK